MVIKAEEDGDEEDGVGRSYSSPIMVSRRKRITQEARAILADGGVKALTIHRLCEQADVAVRTIYRAFGDKDGVILAAINEHMDSIRDFLAINPGRGDVESVFKELDWLVAELFRSAAFGLVVIEFYFSQAPRVEAVKALRSVPNDRAWRWLDLCRRQGLLLPGLDQERVARHFADAEYVMYHRWAVGEIPNDTLADELKANFLLNAIGVVAEPERGRLIEMLTPIYAHLGALNPH
jgi:AcrR family transcriptional regulator